MRLDILAKKEMEEKLKLSAYEEDFFKENSEKVRFFTGLIDWDTLMRLFKFVSSSSLVTYRSLHSNSLFVH